MAKIVIKHLRDPLYIENERAEKLKAIWMNEETPRDKVVEIEHWVGAISEIKSIEMERSKSKNNDVVYPEMSREERERVNSKTYAFLRENFPGVYKKFKDSIPDA